MNAMVLEKVGTPLRLRDLPMPIPATNEVLIRVHACGVCRTDLHLYDGDLPTQKLPLILGHQIVGTIVAQGAGVTEARVGDRVGVPWLGGVCGACVDCIDERENLCGSARYTGCHIDGGYAEYTVANPAFCFPLPANYSNVEAAPLLCAGLIGLRALRMAGEGRRIGLYGFGASAHIVAQIVVQRGGKVYAFTRANDMASQAFARDIGAVWAGNAEASPPTPLDAAIIFAPVGALVPIALAAVAPGGTVVCAGIHMSDIPSFPYRLLWGERTIRSVANLTRQDGRDFFDLASRVPFRIVTESIPLAAANEALLRLQQGRLQGAAVLVMDDAAETLSLPFKGRVGEGMG